jgi:hypothetical protein
MEIIATVVAYAPTPTSGTVSSTDAKVLLFRCCSTTDQTIRMGGYPSPLFHYPWDDAIFEHQH